MRTGKPLCILAGIAFLALAQIQIAHAQEDTWSSGGPYEASVWSIAIHPTNSQRMFIATMENFIFQTTDGGAEWSLIESTPDPEGRLEARNVRVVKIHPFGPDTIFIATVRGAYKSTDGGEGWTLLPIGIDHGPDWPVGEWDRFEISGTNPPVLFVGNGMSGALFRSTDSGESWLPINGPSSMKVVKADPVSPNIVYIAAGARLWKSSDSGATWQFISQIGGLNTDIEVDPVDPEIIYIARWATDALIKSTDGGESWIDITPSGLSDNWLKNVEVAPLDHNTIIVCSSYDRVMRSTDGGANWEEANQGITGANRRAQTLTSDHETGIIYLGMYAGGIYRSTDDGASWEKISYNVTGAQMLDISVNMRNPDTLFAATKNGIYMSVDGAAIWEYVELDYPDSNYYFNWVNVEVDPYDPSYVYANYSGRSGSGYNMALYRSTDGGATWESFTQGLPLESTRTEIAVADYGNGARRLFMGSWEGLFRSDNLGESWSLCQGGLPPDIRCAYALNVSRVNPDLVYVGDWGEGLYKSTDGGMSWAPLANAPGSIYEIACGQINPDIVYIIGGYSDDGNVIYKSTDGGQSWAEISNDIPGNNPRWLSGLAVNPFNPDNIFALSYNRGFFQTHDGGGSWEDFNLNLGTAVQLGRTVIDPVDTSRIVLGLWGNSVWTITRTRTGIDLVDNTLPAAFFASSYPNPFNPSTTIEYSLPDKAFVTVDIYDLLGRRVERLVSQDQRAGSYRVVWDAKEQASGVYFYRIDAGEISDMRKMILLK